MADRTGSEGLDKKQTSGRRKRATADKPAKQDAAKSKARAAGPHNGTDASQAAKPQKGNLAQEMAAYLRARREEVGLSQKQLALQGKKLGVTFDNSWVSQWERLGPKPSFIKTLAYLKLIDVDFDLLQEMSRVEIEVPEVDDELSSDELDGLLDRCRELLVAGRSALAFGTALRGLELADSNPGRKSSFLLAASTIAKRTDHLLLAEHFAHRACALAESEGNTLLLAKIQAQIAALEVHREDFENAESRLRSALERSDLDSETRAYVFQNLAFLIKRRDGQDAAQEFFERALHEFPNDSGNEVVPRLLASIGEARAKSGDRQSAQKAARESIRLSEEKPILKMFTLFEAGRGLAHSGKHRQALQLLREAEELAEELGASLRLFEIRLDMLMAAKQLKDKALESMLNKRLRSERPHVRLTPSLLRAYSSLVQEKEA